MQENVNPKTIFSSGFDEFLKRSRLSQESVSKKCGVSASVVSGWRAGRCLPTFESLKALYSLGMSPALMFGGIAGEYETLFGDLSKNSPPNDSDLLSWWHSVLVDENKSDIEKIYFFFMQANTLRSVIEDYFNK